MSAMTFEQFVGWIDEVVGTVDAVPYDEKIYFNLRTAVAGEFHGRLVNGIVQRNRHLRGHQVDRALIYTHAAPIDFATAVAKIHSDFLPTAPSYDRVTKWNCIPILRDGGGIYVDCGTLIFPILSATRYSWPKERWQIRLTEFGARLLSGRPEAPTRKHASTVNVQSEQSAGRTLSRMAAAFFGLSLGGGA